jgi:hypothetical protein
VVWYENYDLDYATPPRSENGTYTQIAYDSQNTWRAHVRIFVSSPLTASGAITVVAPAPLTYLVVAEFSGVSGTLDGGAQSAGYPYSTPYCPGSGMLTLTTANAGALLLGGFANAADGGPIWGCAPISGTLVPGHPACSAYNAWAPTYQIAGAAGQYEQAVSVYPGWNAGTNSCLFVALQPTPDVTPPPGTQTAFPVTATAKGPNQINLTWGAPPLSGSSYGYIVEIQSAGDPRYATFTEMQPIPPASGYTCDSAANWVGHGTGCTISDTSGVHVYNPTVNGVPLWVTEAQYIDPQDGTPAQFIASGLKSNTLYRFRVRTYTGSTAPVYGDYSAVATATTDAYNIRYVSTLGNDGNDGTAPDSAHAWRSINKASGIACGTELVVMGGSYANEYFWMNQNCTPRNKAVVIVNPGDTATITSNAHLDWGAAVTVAGTNIVIDGLNVSINGDSDYALRLNGTHNALFNVGLGPSIVPSSYGGVAVQGAYNLIYRSYLHDYGSPFYGQNPSGNGGFVLTVEGSHNVMWSNHFTRGGHDTSLCHNGCSYNRWLNNIFDGGWGMAFEVVFGGSSYNLFEGAISRDPGALEARIYKPGFELSYSNNVVRRSIFAGTSAGSIGKAVEISAYDTAANNLVYNNVFYNVARCYFQSDNSGVAAYDGVKVQNNICQFTGDATEMYLNNATSGAVSYNSFRMIGGTGNEASVVWNQDGPYAPYQLHQTVTFADATYAPAWQKNAGLSVLPVSFTDVTHMDFHLAPASLLRGAGTRVVDPQWGFSFPGGVDLGAYGLTSPTGSAR